MLCKQSPEIPKKNSSWKQFRNVAEVSSLSDERCLKKEKFFLNNIYLKLSKL